MWQAVLVGLIVLAASLYAGWALLPAVPRLRLARAVARWSRRPGRPQWLGRAAGALESRASSRLGGCSDCSAAEPPASRTPAERPPGD